MHGAAAGGSIRIVQENGLRTGDRDTRRDPRDRPGCVNPEPELPSQVETGIAGLISKGGRRKSSTVLPGALEGLCTELAAS